MARKPSERRHQELSNVGDVNLLPIMNLLVILIPFLLFVSSFIVLGVINVSSYRIDPGVGRSPERAPGKPQLKLTVAVTDQGFRLKYNLPANSEGSDDGDQNFIPKVMGKRCGGKLNAFSCAKNSDCPGQKLADGRRIRPLCQATRDYDYRRLNEELARIKKLRPDERVVTIMAESEISFGTLVQVMDSTRERDNRGKLKPTALFPDVILGTGISY